MKTEKSFFIRLLCLILMLCFVCAIFCVPVSAESHISTCFKCGSVFYDDASYNNHLANCDYVQCGYCGRYFSSWALNQHYMACDKHPDRYVFCDYCGERIEYGTHICPLKPEVLYSLNYSANGGSGAPSSRTGNGLINLSKDIPERNGYIFLGWADTPNATVEQYQPKASFNLKSDTVLYAVWEKKTTSQYMQCNKCRQEFASIDDYYAHISACDYKQCGYCGEYFSRQIIGAHEAVCDYNPNNIREYVCEYCGKVFILENGYQYHIANAHNGTQSFTLIYSANGGTGTPSAQTGNGNITLSDTRPTRGGYTFLGWARNSNSTTAQYQPGSTFSLNENTTLYAVWQKSNSPSNPTASAKLNAKSSTTVDYRSKVNITATASGVPDGYFLAIYSGNTLLEKGTKDKVSYTPKDNNKPAELKSDITYTVKVVDGKNAVQKDSNGKDLTANVEIKVKQGFFDKLIAFFKGLFGLLPTVEIKP